MNNERRKTIGQVIANLENEKSSIEYEAEAEQEYADNMPENMQGSEKYERAEEVSMELDQIQSEIDDIISRLEELTQ